MIYYAGPYIGDFENEILTFRPYIKWIKSKIEAPMYVNTHSNRSFLYDEPDDTFMSVPVYLSRAELDQSGYIHKQISAKEYNTLVKLAKDEIVEIENCVKKDIKQYNVSYVKSKPIYSIYHKLFEPIRNFYDVENTFKDKIVYIPANTEKRKHLRYIKDFLEDTYDYGLIGDKRTRFKAENEIIHRYDYFSNGFKYLIRAITEARAVICPAGVWTAICNLQQTPVFSWGEVINQFRDTGIYHFGNNSCMTVIADNGKAVVKMIKYFMENCDAFV